MEGKERGKWDEGICHGYFHKVSARGIIISKNSDPLSTISFMLFLNTSISS